MVGEEGTSLGGDNGAGGVAAGMDHALFSVFTWGKGERRRMMARGGRGKEVESFGLLYIGRGRRVREREQGMGADALGCTDGGTSDARGW